MKLFFTTILLFLCFQSHGANLPSLMSYPKKEIVDINDNKIKVLIFLSRSCPCTQMNLPYLNQLAIEFPNFQFIGIHSKKNSSTKEIEELIEKYNPNFFILDDSDLLMANAIRANRTPQAFILNEQNEILFSGGITDRTNPTSASQFYLKNALNQLINKKEISVKKARSLGCTILR